MTCPVCRGKTRVLDTRSDYDAVYRRRKCKECGYTMTTTEYENDGSAMKELERSFEAKARRHNE